ncbi:MAG: hypothetical protein N2Z74_06535, partial [Syntrophales bacterium]|nr:hypothetical protein [Syntrophales bacterium]
MVAGGKGRAHKTDEGDYHRYVGTWVFYFLAGLVLLVTGAITVSVHLRDRLLPPPPGPDLRLSYYETSVAVATDHDVFYHAIGPSLDYARQALSLIHI